ncbi:MAG: hypothetical protein JSS02_31770 [Planctomycetes bacterium]|nr:hypothetical protein [Planctomycetota bacterium]
MSSWEYAFLFPQSPNQLRPASAIGHLTQFGAEFDRNLRLCVPVDDEGHLLDVGEEVALKEPFERDLSQYLRNRNSFSIQLRSSEIVVSVQFMLGSANPHISLGWSRRLFDRSPPDFQMAFWSAIRAFAKDCDAGYVLIVDDAPDHFEDRFLDIDGKRFVDCHVDHGYGLGLREIWLQTSAAAVPPDGLEFGPSEEIGRGFLRYSLRN